jgi:hypothetical protein
MRIMTLHYRLLKKVVKLPTDFEPYGIRKRDRVPSFDCSCGCKYFRKLEGELGFDWGVCVNVKSPRFAMLTFEHQGCRKFEHGSSVPHLRKSGPAMKKGLKWDKLYGLGKGLWKGEDAQDYVNRMRADRI